LTRRATGALTGRASCRGRAFGRAFGIIEEGAMTDISTGMIGTDGALTSGGAGASNIWSCSLIPLLNSESVGDLVSV
jgi:hypothetical protein